MILAALRRHFSIEEASPIIAAGKEEAILICTALAVPLESYSREKSVVSTANAADSEDYGRAEEEVRKMELGPAAIPHHRSKGP